MGHKRTYLNAFTTTPIRVNRKVTTLERSPNKTALFFYAFYKLFLKEGV